MAARGLMCGSKRVCTWQQVWQWCGSNTGFWTCFSTETPKCKVWSVAGDGLRRGSVKVGTWQSKGCGVAGDGLGRGSVDGEGVAGYGFECTCL